MSYYLKNNQSTEKTSIILAKRIQGKMFKYSTGKVVLPKNWSKKDKKVINDIQSTNINKYLKRLLVKFESLKMTLDGNGELTHEKLRLELDNHTNRTRSKPKAILPLTFKDVWTNEWIPALKNNKAPSTIQKKRYTLKSLEDFEKEANYKLDFDTINEKFAEEFKVWALQARKNNGDNRYNKDNSIHKIINITKDFMKWANKRGFCNCEDYKLINGYQEVYFEPFALNDTDIKKLTTLDLNSINWSQFGIRACNLDKTKIALERTRDAFVFRSLCGIRFSDYQSLTPVKLQGGSISIVTKKTGTKLDIPIQKYAQEILKKYNYNVPKLANQNENENLKLLSRIAGFDESVTVTFKRGGKKHEEVKKRWELVSTHTARKTFITNCLRAGIDAYIVMELVGIKKESTFQRYAQITNSDVNKAMNKLDSLLAL